MDGIGACTPSERAVRLPRASRPETTSLRSRPRTAPPVVLPQKPRRLATQSEELTDVQRLLLERAGAWALRRRATELRRLVAQRVLGSANSCHSRAAGGRCSSRWG